MTPTESEFQCSDCGADVSEGAETCLACGAKLEWEPEAVKKSLVDKCAACGSQLSPGQMICSRCGSLNARDTNDHQVETVELNLKKLFFSTSGRLNRAKYHFTFLCILLAAVLLGLVIGLIVRDPEIGWIALALSVFLLRIPFQAVQEVKRLHDLGRSGWHYFLLLVPLYDIYLAIALFFFKGQDSANDYGPDPLAEPWDSKRPLLAVSLLLIGLVLCGWEFSILEPVQVSLARQMTSADSTCQISVPSNWRQTSSLNKSAILQATDASESIGLIVLSEEKEDLIVASLQEYHQLAKSNLFANIQSPDSSATTLCQLKGYQAAQTQIGGVVDNQRFVYLLTDVETNDYFYQILAFAAPSALEKSRPLLQRIIQSFEELFPSQGDVIGRKEDAESAVRSAVSAKAKVDSATVPMDATFFDGPLQLDDLDVTEIAMRLERQLQITIPDSALTSQITPRQLVSVVREALQRKEDKGGTQR